MGNIDLLLMQLSHDIMVPLLEDYIKKMLTVDNWKMTHAAIMTIS